MHRNPYTVRWLIPKDAEQVAAVEERVHVSEHRAGRGLILDQLEATEADGSNLSMGLYCRGRLVGFGMGFVMRDRREMAAFFDAPLPHELNPDQSAIYVADWVVEPAHREGTRLIIEKFGELLREREDLRDVPIDAFSTPEYAAKWSTPNRLFARLGWRFAAQYPFEDPRLGKTLYWLTFDRVAPTALSGGKGRDRGPRVAEATDDLNVTLLRTPEDWHALRPHWDTLLAHVPNPCVTESWEWLRTAQAHFGMMERPYGLVVVRKGQPVGFVPWQIAARWESGAHRSCVTFGGEPDAARTQRILLGATDNSARSALIARAMADRQQWELIDLIFHDSQQQFATALTSGLRHHGSPVSRLPGPSRYSIDVRGRWTDYLAAHPVAAAILPSLDTLRFEMHRAPAPDIFERYLHLEQTAPDDEAGTGACASGRHISFYRALATSFGETLGLHIGLVYSGDAVAAGALGFLWRRRFYLIHVTRAESFASAGAERVALARLIAWAFENGECDALDLSPLSHAEDIPLAADLPQWATTVSNTLRVRAHRASLAGWWTHLLEQVRGC